MVGLNGFGKDGRKPAEREREKHLTEPRKTTFHDVRKEVFRRIREGVWPPGAVLPTEIELAEEFGCARATVNRALRELTEEGIIERRRKSGTRVKMLPDKQARFAIPIVRQEVEERGARYRYALVYRQEITAPDWLVPRIGLRRGQKVLHLQCMHYADNAPFQFEERWVNIAAVPSILEADLETVGPNEWLLREIPYTRAEISFAAVAADRRLADFLSVTEGTPLFQMERTTELGDRPVTLVRMTYHQGYRLTTTY
jgi:GntR family histidine utilization transcriptional repressor